MLTKNTLNSNQTRNKTKSPTKTLKELSFLSSKYEKSYMHKDQLDKVIYINKIDTLITISIEGMIKFWKKTSVGLEFIKEIRTFTTRIKSFSYTNSCQFALASSEFEENLCVFDLICIDLIQKMRINLKPNYSVIISNDKNDVFALVSDKVSSNMYLYMILSDFSLKSLVLILDFHVSPVRNIDYCQYRRDFFSVCEKGYVEFWKGRTLFRKNENENENLNENDRSNDSISKSIDNISKDINEANEEFIENIIKETSKNNKNKKIKTIKDYIDIEVDYQIKSKTDLFELVDKNEKSLFATWSQKGKYIGIVCESGCLYIFKVSKGVIIYRYSLPSNHEGIIYNLYFNDSDEYVLHSNSTLGIRMVSLKDTSLYNIYCDKERLDITYICPLFKSHPSNLNQTIVVLSKKSNRFFLFSNQVPTEKDNKRDIINEPIVYKKEEKERLLEESNELPLNVVIETTKGEIHIRLFPKEAPKTVKNFVVLSKKGYFNGLIFHRVVLGFMIQTGCPLGNGTGGESCFGGTFEDEFHESLKFDRGFTVGMANKGPNTNGSQFFITTCKCSWLDGKHSIFGRVVKGMDTVEAIENLKCDSNDKPLVDVRIIRIVI